MPPPIQTEVMTGVNAVRSFARVNGISEDLAVEIYERELAQLGSDAKIERFVAVLAEKHAKDALMSQARPRFGRSLAAETAVATSE